MKALYTNEQFVNTKYTELLPLECKECQRIFYKEKYKINTFLKPNSKRKGDFCSWECYGKSKITKKVVNCLCCNKTFEKFVSQIDKHPQHFCSTVCTGIYRRTKIKVSCVTCNKIIEKIPSNIKKNNFCSLSCSSKYNATHKTTGTNRSKLEKYIEQYLSEKYPKILVFYNDTKAIGKELDIYIPSLNLAFELNGIFHYEPVYGVDKLNRTQTNDLSKTLLCHEHKIDLCVIDTTIQKYFKESTSQIFLDIITNIINERI